MFKYVARLLRLPKKAIRPEDPLHLTLRPQQVVNDRYKILSRLGQGYESTVWLAEELAPSRKTVAVKVLTDYVTSLQEEHAFEYRVMKRISNLPSSQPGIRNLPPLLDHFMASGVRGDHLCLVTEALGPSVQDIIKAEDGPVALSPPIVKHLTRQILRALSALHDGCNVVHTGQHSVHRGTLTPDGKFDAARILDPDNVVLIDYGTAIPLDARVNRLIQPVALRSPEVLLGCEWGVKADIWNLGCIVFQLLTAQNLFRPKPLQRFTAEQYHLARILGTLVDDADFARIRTFFQTGRKYDQFFNDNGQPQLIIAQKSRESLQEILEIYGVYTPDLLEFLTAMLRVHPDDRLSATELQTLPWLRDE
ncbi:kinase-like domain-containing protein [Irpex lacteus]|nr:kinase-like domain-containing protein [Irpex lacteus]